MPGDGHAAASPAASSAAPSPDEARTAASADDAAPADAAAGQFLLTKEMASKLNGDGYSFGHDFAMRTYSEGEDVMPALVCATASAKYVEGEFGDYDLAPGASEVLRSSYVLGCTEAYERLIEDGVYATDTEATSNVDEYGYVFGSGGPLPSTLTDEYTPDRAERQATSLCRDLRNGAKFAMAVITMQNQGGLDPKAALEMVTWSIDSHCPEIYYQVT